MDEPANEVRITDNDGWLLVIGWPGNPSPDEVLDFSDAACELLTLVREWAVVRESRN